MKEDKKMNEKEYDNIFNLVSKTGFKKIIVIRDSWNDGNYLIVTNVIFNPSNRQGLAFGFYHYKNGHVKCGTINCAGCYSWKIIKVLNEELEFNNEKNKFNRKI